MLSRLIFSRGCQVGLNLLDMVKLLGETFRILSHFEEVFVLILDIFQLLFHPIFGLMQLLYSLILLVNNKKKNLFNGDTVLS